MSVTKGSITLSDVIDNPWVDRKEDALNLSYADETLDVIIANNMIHHLAQQLKFFQEANRVLKKGGRLLIQDVNCSLMMQRLLRFMHIEDFDFDVDVFDVKRSCINQQNPWDGNDAIPNLLFEDVSEFLVYIVSGGINGKTFIIPLPYIVLKVLDSIDNILVSKLHKVFALQIRVVLEKK